MHCTCERVPRVGGCEDRKWGSLRGAGEAGCDAFGDVQELFAEYCSYVGGGIGVGSWDETGLSPVSLGG